LLLADAAGAPPRSLLAGWDVLEADSLAHARFLQQFDPFDVVLVDYAQVAEGDRDNLSCLTLPGWTSLVVLSDTGADTPTPPSPDAEGGLGGGGQGPQHWLPRRPALEYPSLLAVVLNQAAQVSKLQRLLQRLEQTLQSSRRQADRLIELLWQVLPAEGRTPWLNQRSVLERLGEEVTRSQRYAVPLSVVLGELDGGPPRQPPDGLEHGEQIGWVARQIARSKRRCDVAGQYGPNGFLLLLPETTDKGASSCCRRLRPLLERTEEMPEGVKTPPRIRFATASLSPTTATAQSLLSRAEERLTRVHSQS
jgi:diguanylate cyclase (GGDEF)-like protein